MRINCVTYRIITPLLICAAATFAQSSSSGNNDKASAGFSSAPVNLSYEPVGSGDLLSILVTSCPEASRSYRISPDGTISLALVPRPLRVAGLVPSAIETAVAEELAHARILLAPVVAVSVLEYRSRPVSVVGAVKRPLTFQALGTVKLLDAIARAEGLSPEAGPVIVITKSPAGATALQISTKQLLSGTDPSLNIE